MSTNPPLKCRWPVGAEILTEGMTHFRVWAPAHQQVAVVFENNLDPVSLTPEAGGYFSGVVAVGPGTRYRFRLGDSLYPDPVSRFQPDGPHGPSEVVDPRAFHWTDSAWPGCKIEGQVIYEFHIGSFTPEGTWRAAMEKLPLLADVGITLLEMMPIADFPGQFGWGYDGVNLFAPTRLYGRPDDLRAFIDRAHSLGLGVLLDVVYNHLGPDGNHLPRFAKNYFNPKHKTDWGDAINYDGEDCATVREFFLTNAAYWIAEYHFDGLRLDATQEMYDDNPSEHILAAISRVTRQTAGKRSVVLVAENEVQNTRLIHRSEKGGYGLDGLWNDDLHHSLRVAATGKRQAYYSDYRGAPQEFINAAKYGYLWQGQWYTWQKKARGTPTFGLPPAAFVTFLDNHDQIANSPHGLPLCELVTRAQFRTLTAFLLLCPGTPMLFQGQEFASSAPFYYWADHNPELASLVARGRTEFMHQFASLTDPDHAPALPQPHDRSGFERCKLDWSQRERNGWAIKLYKDLISLRNETSAFARQEPGSVDGVVLGDNAFVIRYFVSEDDRLLLVNFGRELHLETMPEPLLAPPLGESWRPLWHSEDVGYGGEGVSPLDLTHCWKVPAYSAIVLGPGKEERA
jgi:maltooligosyltrehalose trehalohydrolase